MQEYSRQHNILYSCVGENHLEHDPFVYEHALAFSISGIAEFYSGDSVISYPAGTLCLARRNQLLKIVKKPAGGKPFSSITVFLQQEMLKKYSQEYDLHADGMYVGEPNVLLKYDAFFKGYFESLKPYFAETEKLTPILAKAKTTEVIELLLRNPALKNFLFDFNDPHKIDLEAYMNRNYSYNVPLTQFAKLTGRSLSTFKRDFTKLYDTTPEKWLQKRRLDQAHFLMAQKGKRPSDIYLQLGFETLSHFSYSFKKQFGQTPTTVQTKSSGASG